jgi:hypothetical protein
MGETAKGWSVVGGARLPERPKVFAKRLVFYLEKVATLGLKDVPSLGLPRYQRLGASLVLALRLFR